MLRLSFLSLCVLISRVVSAGTFVYFAAEEPPAQKDQVDESKYCYRFTADSLEAQKNKLLKKYGDELKGIKIETTEGAKRVFTAYRIAEDGRRMTYFYSDDPAACDHYQKTRLLPPNSKTDDVAAPAHAQPTPTTRESRTQRNCGPAVENAVKSYFLPIQGKSYRYDILGDDNRNGTIARTVTYLESKNIDGEYSVVFRTVFLLGPLKIIRKDVYAIVCNEVYLSATENNVIGKQVFDDRQVKLVLPIKEKDAHWTWSEGVVNYKNTATFVGNVTTPFRRFNDILLIAEEYDYDGVRAVNKRYYAKGYGLVKEELFGNGHLIPGISNHLARIE